MWVRNVRPLSKGKSRCLPRATGWVSVAPTRRLIWMRPSRARAAVIIRPCSHRARVPAVRAMVSPSGTGYSQYTAMRRAG